MVSKGNLPPNRNINSTTEYFNNFFSDVISVSPDVNDAVIGYFESITGDTESAKVLASSIIYTAVTQGIDPMSLIDQLRDLSRANKPAIQQSDENVINDKNNIPLLPGLTYIESFSANSETKTQTLSISLIGKTGGADISSLEIAGDLSDYSGNVSAQLSLIPNEQGDVIIQEQITSGSYGIFQLESSGAWTYFVTQPPAASTDGKEVFTVNRENGDPTQQINLSLSADFEENVYITKITYTILDTFKPQNVTGQLNFDGITPQTNVLSADTYAHFGRFSINANGDWSYTLNPFRTPDTYANKGPVRRPNNLNEVNAFLAVLLNSNRVGTSLLGLSNNPPINKYISRAIKP